MTMPVHVDAHDQLIEILVRQLQPMPDIFNVDDDHVGQVNPTDIPFGYTVTPPRALRRKPANPRTQPPRSNSPRRKRTRPPQRKPTSSSSKTR